jgi:hypothetical protein
MFTTNSSGNVTFSGSTWRDDDGLAGVRVPRRPYPGGDSDAVQISTSETISLCQQAEAREEVGVTVRSQGRWR